MNMSNALCVEKVHVWRGDRHVLQGVSAQIQPRDRWAIATYIRALQLSQHATLADVPQEDRQKLSQPATTPAVGRR